MAVYTLKNVNKNQNLEMTLFVASGWLLVHDPVLRKHADEAACANENGGECRLRRVIKFSFAGERERSGKERG